MILFTFLALNPKKTGGPPTKIVISRKISSLTYPEKSWLFLKHSKEAFCKKIEKCPTWLPWGCLKVKKRSKKCKKNPILTKFYIKAQKKVGPENGLFLVHPYSGSINEFFIFFLQNVHLITKIYSLKKISLLTSLQAEKKGWGPTRPSPPSPTSFVCQKAKPFKGYYAYMYVDNHLIKLIQYSGNVYNVVFKSFNTVIWIIRLWFM